MEVLGGAPRAKEFTFHLGNQVWTSFNCTVAFWFIEDLAGQCFAHSSSLNHTTLRHFLCKHHLPERGGWEGTSRVVDVRITVNGEI